MCAARGKQDQRRQQYGVCLVPIPNLADKASCKLDKALHDEPEYSNYLLRLTAWRHILSRMSPLRVSQRASRYGVNRRGSSDCFPTQVQMIWNPSPSFLQRYLSYFTMQPEQLNRMYNSCLMELQRGLEMHRDSPGHWRPETCSLMFLDTCVDVVPTGKENGVRSKARDIRLCAARTMCDQPTSQGLLIYG